MDFSNVKCSTFYNNPSVWMKFLYVNLFFNHFLGGPPWFKYWLHYSTWYHDKMSGHQQKQSKRDWYCHFFTSSTLFCPFIQNFKNKIFFWWKKDIYKNCFWLVSFTVSPSDTNSSSVSKKKKIKSRDKSEKKLKKVLKIKKEGLDYTSQSLNYSEDESLSPINLDIKEEPLPDLFQQEYVQVLIIL